MVGLWFMVKSNFLVLSVISTPLHYDRPFFIQKKKKKKGTSDGVRIALTNRDKGVYEKRVLCERMEFIYLFFFAPNETSV